MGRKNQIRPFLLIQNGGLDQANIDGKETVVAQTDVVNILAVWTGGQATSGNLIVEVWSSDATGWVALDFGATISLDTASSNHQLIIQQVSFEKVRVKYSRTNGSASGTLNVAIFATTVGA